MTTATILQFRRPETTPAATVTTTSPRLIDLIPRWEQALHALDRSPASIEHYVWALQRFIAWLGGEPTLEQFTWEAVLNYRDSMGARRLSGSTILNVLSVLSSFADWAVERRLLRENPTAGIARPEKAPPNPRPLTTVQLDTLLDAIKLPPNLPTDATWYWRRNRRIVYLMLFAGLRRSEVCGLRWSHILVEEQMIDLQDGTKGRKPRRVGIHPDLLAELLLVPAHARQPDHAVAGQPNGTLITRSAIENIFERWLGQDLKLDERMGTRIHPHKLRTTFASYFIWSGGSTLTLQKLLGHADVNTTQRYALTDDQQKLEEVNQLRFTRRGEGS